jgi:hypothetical protein
MALFLVDQTFSDVLSISNTKQTISQSNEKRLEHYLHLEHYLNCGQSVAPQTHYYRQKHLKNNIDQGKSPWITRRII